MGFIFLNLIGDKAKKILEDQYHAKCFQLQGDQQRFGKNNFVFWSWLQLKAIKKQSGGQVLHLRITETEFHEI